MEMGSFLELQFPKGLEFYKGEKNIARLNTGRAAIWHAFRVLDCNCIWLPYYQCDSIREILNKKSVQIKYYHIDKHFNPTDLTPSDSEAVLLVNYYGVMSPSRMKNLAKPVRTGALTRQMVLANWRGIIIRITANQPKMARVFAKI